MPPIHFAILVASVIVLAGLTIAALAAGPGLSFLAALLPLALLLRLVLWRGGRDRKM